MTFEETLQKWHKIFEGMKPGDKIDIQVIGKRDIPLFTAMCKEYINRGHEDFEFSNDYRYFKRTNNF